MDDKNKIIENLLDTRDDISIWDDGFSVLDLEIEREENTLVRDLMGIKCPICEYTLVSHGHHLLAMRDEDALRGADVNCPRCEQDWYIHYPVKVPKMEDMRET